MLIISHSGRTRDLMNACDIARKQDATTIVIKGHSHLATCVALAIGGATLGPLLREMKNNLRSKL